jgi:hypothetical protein
MIDDLIMRCVVEIDAPTAEAEKRIERIIRNYMEDAYDLGKERGAEKERDVNTNWGMF